MIYLLLTILLNTVLFVLFKLFPRYKIDALQAIVVNYITCVITGSIFLGRMPISSESIVQPWFGWSLFLGGYFISLFSFIAYCTRQLGITTATVSNKLSLVIPVVFSVWLYREQLTVVNIAGLLLALPAVYLSTKTEDSKVASRSLLLPALLFLSSGAMDTMMKYVEHRFLQDADVQAIFPIHVFAFAATIGSLYVLVQVLRGKAVLHYRNVIAGVVLGVPNYFSIYYFIRLLNSDVMESSSAIPVNNIGIVLCCACAGILFFKEPSTKLRIAGLALSVLSIILIAIS